MSDFDPAAWAAACDSFFETTERNARIFHACRVLAELLADNDDFPELWAQAVQS
jgi:hypothetical protein